jgi:hypothetical protein
MRSFPPANAYSPRCFLLSSANLSSRPISTPLPILSLIHTYVTLFRVEFNLRAKRAWFWEMGNSLSLWKNGPLHSSLITHPSLDKSFSALKDTPGAITLLEACFGQLIAPVLERFDWRAREVSRTIGATSSLTRALSKPPMQLHTVLLVQFK